MTTLALDGRILFLSDDPERIAAQLSGARITRLEAGALRDDVSTDEITPGASMGVFDERLGAISHSGFRAGGVLAMPEGTLKAAGASVLVAGKRYGKGSSREHSPLSERYAGIRLVIAESFERIYRQNADNVGLFTSTDLTLADRIAAGEPVELEELLTGRDAVAAGILRAGGLLSYGQKHLQGAVPASPSDDQRPRTLVEKILERHALKIDGLEEGFQAGTGTFVKADWRFIIEAYTGMAMHLMESTLGDPVKLNDTATIRGFAEHLSFFSRSPAGRDLTRSSNMEALYELHELFVAKYGVISHGRLPGITGSHGICHPIMTEQYALPGELIVGTDSHTPHSGALGCLAFGVGTSDMANAMLTGAVRITVPESLLIDVSGTLPAGVAAKDLVLHLLAHPALKAGSGLGRVFEFAGSAVEAMTLDERATLTNMAAELGGFTGIVSPDAETVRFLKELRGLDVTIESWMHSDPDARYADVISVDAATLSPFVASPGDPGNSKPLSEVVERPRIDIAFGGTCTGGKRDDFDAYHDVLAWAVSNGLTLAPGVALYLQYGTLDVRDYCVARGYDDTFRRIGAEVMLPACGACGNAGPGASSRPDQITVSAQNRNFPGRSGPGQVWLASPATVAASAIVGSLSSFAELERSVAGRSNDSVPLS